MLGGGALLYLESAPPLAYHPAHIIPLISSEPILTGMGTGMGTEKKASSSWVYTHDMGLKILETHTHGYGKLKNPLIWV